MLTEEMRKGNMYDKSYSDILEHIVQDAELDIPRWKLEMDNCLYLMEDVVPKETFDTYKSLYEHVLDNRYRS